MTPRPNIFFAPSGSGKSTLARTYPDIFVDGDVVVRNTVGWPKQPEWWKKMSKEELRGVYERNMIVVLAQALSDSRTVLFVPDLPEWCDADFFARLGLRVAVWVPPRPTLRERLASPVRNKKQPHDPEAAAAAINDAVGVANRAHLSIYMAPDLNAFLPFLRPPILE